MNDRLAITSIFLIIFYLVWYMWDQHELIKLQNEKIKEQQEVIMQMEQLIDTQFLYIERLINPPPTYDNPPINRSI